MGSQLPLFLQELVKNIKNLHEKPSPVWKQVDPSHDDIFILQKEALTASNFDRLNIRRTLYNNYISGRANLVCFECLYGRVLLLQENQENVMIPFKTWGRVLQWFGGFVRVCWFAADIPRLLPRKGKEIEEIHVNGGYTLPCSKNAVIVYRKEEATRVLIHELIHANCLDHQDKSVSEREAETETFAELVYIAILSKGDVKKAKKFWEIQSKWIVNQNAVLRKYHHVLSLNDYAARYTIAREQELQKMGIALPPASSGLTKFSSCRLTSDAFDEYLE
jgi:hypothetical protein